jgi:hypothetical protein
MMYSSKTINSASFIPAIKKTLAIPEEVEIGIQLIPIHRDGT